MRGKCLALSLCFAINLQAFEGDHFSLSYSDKWQEQAVKEDQIEIFLNGAFGKVVLDVSYKPGKDAKGVYELLGRYGNDPKVSIDLGEIYVRHVRKVHKREIEHLYIGLIEVNGYPGWKRIYRYSGREAKHGKPYTVYFVEHHFPTKDGAILVDVMFGWPSPLIGTRVSEVLRTLVIHE